jgi:hypothetical protein
MELIVDFPRNQLPPRVTFAVHLEMNIVENLSLEHKEALWFSSQEMASFKDETTKMLKEIVSSNRTVGAYATLHIEETSSFMGLESYLSKDAGQEIGHRRGKIRWAVVREQQRQRDTGVSDPEAIAIISEACSEQARLRARLIGLLHTDALF